MTDRTETDRDAVKVGTPEAERIAAELRRAFNEGRPFLPRHEADTLKSRMVRIGGPQVGKSDRAERFADDFANGRIVVGIDPATNAEMQVTARREPDGTLTIIDTQVRS
jgi:hypothetical protein